MLGDEATGSDDVDIPGASGPLALRLRLEWLPRETGDGANPPMPPMGPRAGLLGDAGVDDDGGGAKLPLPPLARRGGVAACCVRVTGDPGRLGML